MTIPQVAVVDFETEAIGPRPKRYPPVPVGAAIRWPTGQSEYFAWGHPGGDNNTTFERARALLWEAWQYPVVFHNAAFDMEVAYEHMKLPAPREWHDTQFLLFLCHPHNKSFSLKPCAEQFLGEPPNEQNDLYDWIVEKLKVPRSQAGAHISEAPVSLVEPYAIGDVERTYGLFRLLWPIVDGEMRAPYNREKALMPVLVKMSRRGIRINRTMLSGVHTWLQHAQLHAETGLRGAHAAFNNVNFDSNDEVADAIEKAGFLRPEGWLLTAKGNRQTNKAALEKCVNNPGLVEWLRFRNSCTTLANFVNAWDIASSDDGRVRCQWAQTRSDDGGARTGRIASMNPNLANIPDVQNVVVPKVFHEKFGDKMPVLRKLFIPDQDMVWLSADYNAQELRHAAHFENGALMQAYQADPSLDMHDYAAKMISSILGKTVERKPTKITGFALIYGAGTIKLAEQLGVTPSEARAFRDAYLQAVPGIAGLMASCKRRWDMGQKITTWGGRKVPCEPPAIIDGVPRSFEYKALNMLIQGSAADQTKEALIRADRCTSLELLGQVYDEINAQSGLRMAATSDLRDAMVGIPGFDVPFTVSIGVGGSWAEAQE